MRMCACRGTAGFAHVSCLAEQAKILVAEAEENNLGNKAGIVSGRGGTRVACASKITTASWRARSGGRAGRRTWGQAGDDHFQAGGDDAAWERFIRGKAIRGRGVRDGGRVVYAAAPWRARTQHARSCRAILRTCIKSSDGLNRPCACGETYTLDI